MSRNLDGTYKTPKQLYQEIREEHPEESIGDHWEGIGFYMGDQMWVDPEEFEQQGEYEFEYDFLSKIFDKTSQDAPGTI